MSERERITAERRGGPAPRPALPREASGRALDSRTAARMGAAYGHSFAHIRIHDDAEGARVAASHQAIAVTTGADIAFAPGAYRPGTHAGDALLAHELAHAQQQRDGVEAPGPAHERDAEQATVGAIAHLAGAPGAARARPSMRSAIAPQRCGGLPSWAPPMPTGSLTPSNGVPFVTGTMADRMLSNSPTVGPYVKTRIATGMSRCGGSTGPQRSEGHVHFHPQAEWNDTVMHYVAGKRNPHVDRCDKRYTEAEARAEVPNFAGFTEGSELHLNEATAQITDTLHESMHRYEDDAFVSELGFAAQEGTTELLAQRVCAEQTPPLARTGVYVSETDAMRAMVRVVGIGPLCDAYFNGNLDGLRAATDKDSPGRLAVWTRFMKRPSPDYRSANELFAH